jgi:hypothetical protein
MRKQRFLCFPTKAIVIWQRMDDGGHVRLVESYLREAGGFENVRGPDRSPRRVFGHPLYAVVGESTGPPTREQAAPEPAS